MTILDLIPRQTGISTITGKPHCEAVEIQALGYPAAIVHIDTFNGEVNRRLFRGETVVVALTIVEPGDERP